MPVKDKLGWCSKEAFVVVWAIEEEIKKSSISPDGISNYVESSNSHVIKYQGNYWQDKATQEQGLDSRPLAHFVHFDAEELFEKNADGEHVLDDNGNKKPTGEVIPAYKEWVDTFIVDMKHIQSRQVINSSMVGIDERNRLIQLDLERNFPK
jgi:hypothetical protein